jgi:hypothetical protein
MVSTEFVEPPLKKFLGMALTLQHKLVTNGKNLIHNKDIMIKQDTE